MGEPGSEQLYTLAGADRPYRLIIEEMDDGAATVSERGIMLYVNPCLAHLLGRHPGDIVGAAADSLVVERDRATLAGPLAIAPGDHAHGCPRVPLR